MVKRWSLQHIKHLYEFTDYILVRLLLLWDLYRHLK